MRRSSWVLAGIFLGGLGILGSTPSCAGELSGDPASYRVTRSVSGTCDALPIFAKRCGTSFCHSGSAPPNGLDLKAPGVAARLLGEAARGAGCESRLLVDPKDPSKSFLLEKIDLTTPQCGEQMPFGGALAADELACIHSWVAALGSRDASASPALDGAVVRRPDAGDAGGTP